MKRRIFRRLGILVVSALLMVGVSSRAEAVLRIVGSYNTPSNVRGVHVSGDYAYVTSGSGGFQIIDISDPTSPFLAGAYDTPGFAQRLDVSGNYAYVGSESPGLLIIDISDPASPFLAGAYNTPRCARAVYVSGNYAYVGDVNFGLLIINISDPTSPTLAGTCDIPETHAMDVYVSGNYAYLANGLVGGLPIINISPVAWTRKSDWDAPRLENRQYAYPGSTDLDGDGDYDLVFGNSYAGRPIYAYENTGDASSPEWTRKESWEIRPGFSNTRPAFADLDNDSDYDLLLGENNGACRAYKNTESASSPTWTREPSWDIESIVGMVAAPAFADLDNDNVYDLLVVKRFNAYAYKNTGSVSNPTWTQNSEWDISGDLYGNVNVTADFYDFDNDGDFDVLIGTKAIENIGTVSSPSWSREAAWDSPALTYPSIADLDNDGDGDLLMGGYGGADGGISYAYENTGYSIVGSCGAISRAEDVYVSGNYAYVTDWAAGLQVVDISDPASPTIVGTCDTPGYACGVDVSGIYAYVADYQGGLQVVDISDPFSPTIVDSCDDLPDVAHAVYVSGNYAYVGTCNSLEIIDLSAVGVPLVSSFEFSYTSQAQTAGVPFEMFITAKDGNGDTVTSYIGAVDLTMDYINPSSGTMEWWPPDVSFANGVSRIAECKYNDVGAIRITASDKEDSSITGTSGSIMFYPASFEVTASRPQKVNQEFPLTIKAKNALGDITPNCNLAVSLGVTPHVPAVGGSITPAVIGSYFVDGVEEVSVAYDSWALSVDVDVCVMGLPDYKGTRAGMTFTPHSFEVIVDSPPLDRTMFYTNENIPVIITALDVNSDIIANYGGAIFFVDLPSGSWVTKPPPTYTFSDADGGSTAFIFCSSTGREFRVSAQDPSISADPSLNTFRSDLITVIDASIEVETKSAETEKEVEVFVRIKDANGDVVSDDNSTTFTLTLTPDDNAQIISVSSPVIGGVGSFIIRDNVEEVVTVTPSSTPTLTAVPGVITFKPFVAGPGGIRILHWIEEK